MANRDTILSQEHIMIEEMMPAYERPLMQACFEELEKEVRQKKVRYRRVVVLQSLRPSYEVLEQLYVKEFESTWVSDMELFERLGKKMPEEVKEEQPAVEEEVEDEVNESIAQSQDI